MGDSTGQTPKKETVYGGSTPPLDNKAFAKPPAPGTKGTVYGGPAPTQGTQGTVYSGAAPTQGTVYSGPEPSGTVFDESKFVTKKADASVAIKATTRSVRGVAVMIFIAAALSLIEALIFWSDSPIEGISAAIVCGIFVIIGFFVYRMSRVAFLIALVIYALGTLALLYDAINFVMPVT